MPILTKSHGCALALILFPLYLIFTFDHSLWNPDETRDAGIARSMFVDNNFVTPKLNGEAFLEKPPLYYWSTALVFGLTKSITAGTARLPAALWGFLGVLFTFLIGRRLRGARAGLLAAFILGTSIQYFRVSHMALMDSALAACLTGAFYFYLVGANLLFLLFMVLAFYAKGFVAVALGGLVIGTDLLLKGEPKKLGNLVALGVPLFILLVSPWVYGLWLEGGGPYLKVFFIDNNFTRFASRAADHANNSYFLYFGSLPADFLPWGFLFMGALFRRDTWRRSFPLVWLLAMFVFLTVSSSKRTIYMMPVFPAAALLTAFWLDAVMSEKQLALGEKIVLWLTAVFAAILPLGVFSAGIYLERKFLISAAGLILTLGTAMLAYHRLYKGRIFVCLTGLFALQILALTGADALFIRRLDADKSFLPYIDAVKNVRGGDGILAGIRLSEMERGVFSFYFQENIPDLKTPEAITQFVEAHRSERVLIMTNRNHIDQIPEVLRPQLQETISFRPDMVTRSYLLYQKLPS